MIRRRKRSPEVIKGEGFGIDKLALEVLLTRNWRREAYLSTCWQSYRWGLVPTGQLAKRLRERELRFHVYAREMQGEVRDWLRVEWNPSVQMGTRPEPCPPRLFLPMFADMEGEIQRFVPLETRLLEGFVTKLDIARDFFAPLSGPAFIESMRSRSLEYARKGSPSYQLRGTTQTSYMKRNDVEVTLYDRSAMPRSVAKAGTVRFEVRLGREGLEDSPVQYGWDVCREHLEALLLEWWAAAGLDRPLVGKMLYIEHLMDSVSTAVALRILGYHYVAEANVTHLLDPRHRRELNRFQRKALSRYPNPLLDAPFDSEARLHIDTGNESVMRLGKPKARRRVPPRLLAARAAKAGSTDVASTVGRAS